MPVKSYPLWNNKSMPLAWWESGDEDVVTPIVEWNEGQTQVTKASLQITARASGRTILEIYVNESQAKQYHWFVQDDKRTFTDIVDVTGNLINGKNVFQASYYKELVHPFDVEAVFTVSLVIEFTGEPPAVKPWWEQYLVPAALVTAAIALMAVALKRR